MPDWLISRVAETLAPEGFVQWDLMATLLNGNSSTRGWVGHRRASANGITPYAPRLNYSPPLPGNLLHTDLPPAAKHICTPAGLLRFV